MRTGRVLVLAGLAALVAAMAGQAKEKPARPAPPPVGIAELARLDLLPRFRDAVKVASVSSYDRTGGNDDGFSGRYSFVRKEGDGLVIADLKGPGCVYRMWTPTPTDDPVEFFFDGESSPRLRLTFRQLFDGTRPPFTPPLSGFGGGGFWTYLPLPYRQSLKVVVRAPRVQFYQVNYAAYADGSPVTTFRPEALAEQRETVEKIDRLFAAGPLDRGALLAPPGAKLRTQRVSGSLAPGKPLTLLNARKGGRIVGFKISPASALAGKDRAIVLRATWDAETEAAVLCPAGDFFGYSWGDPAARSLLVGTDADTAYAWFPMPFDRSARLELVNEREKGDPVEIHAEVITADLPRQADEGRFYAVWRRENPTRSGQPYSFIDSRGRGHVVGLALQSQGKVSGNTFFFEGDDQTTLDGELTIHGTGSEDFFNGGWYDVPGRWEGRLSLPFSGCLDYKKHLGRTGAYRLFLTDAPAYGQSVRLTIEHGPERNALPTDYCSVAYLYQAERPEAAGKLPALAERAVVDLDHLVFTPGWSVPVYSFPFERATLAKKNLRLGNEDVRVLSLRTEGQDIFGAHALSLVCEMPAAGRYRVSLEAVRGPEGGRVQLFQNEKAAGEAVDLYAEQTSKSPLLPLGTLDLKEGGNPVFLKLVGKNPAAKGQGLDIVTLHFERIRE